MSLQAQNPLSDSSSLDRILRTATGLFAEYGYHGVSTRQIGAATGLNIATIHHHVGSKRNLYLRVIEELFEQEEQIIGGLLGEIEAIEHLTVEAFGDGVKRLIVEIVRLAQKHPHRQRLYARRWLEVEDELREREAELTLRLYRRLAALIKSGQKSGLVRSELDVENFLRSFDWLVIGYFTSGAFDWQTLRADPFAPERVESFIRFLRDYADRMLWKDQEIEYGDAIG